MKNSRTCKRQQRCSSGPNKRDNVIQMRNCCCQTTWKLIYSLIQSDSVFSEFKLGMQASEKLLFLTLSRLSRNANNGIDEIWFPRNAYINVLLFVGLTCEANRRNSKNDNSVSVIFFLNSLHHNWLQYIEEDVNLNVICTKYRHGYHKLYYRIISKKNGMHVDHCTILYFLWKYHNK